MSRLRAALLVALLAPAITACETVASREPAATLATGVVAELPSRLSARQFAALSEQLSERGGFFDSDNLVSNEASYLHVLDAVRRMGTTGGVYVGVGPDQGFSYIAAVRPRMAFVIDIRRDNLLLHLLYKAAFEEARNRVEYLALFFGRPVPEHLAEWDDRPLTEIIAWVDANPPTPASRAAAARRLFGRLESFAMRISEPELATLRRFHEAYVEGGLDIRFQSMGRPPRPYYPTYRQLLLERDRAGHLASYLASPEDFRFVQSLQRRNLVVPVVGDLAGDSALANIGRWLAARDAPVSLFYASNVEYYLARDGRLDDFGRNLATLPRTEKSVLVRSLFRGSFGIPGARPVPGYLSSQVVTPLDSVVATLTSGEYYGYADLVSRAILP